MEIQELAIVLENRRAQHVTDAKSVPSTRKLRPSDLDLLARTLGGLLEGGVPILKALEGLEHAAHKPDIKNLLNQLQENVRRGVSFSEALEKQGAVPSFFYQTVYAGEISGRVPQVLGELSKYIEKEEVLKRSIREALVYPCFILVVGFITMAVLTCYVLPKLSGVYAQFGSELPAITRVILLLSKLFLPASALLAVLIIGLVGSLKKTGNTSQVLFKIPIFGAFCCSAVRVRFCRLLSLLLESGTPVIEALRVVEKTFGDRSIQKDIANLREALTKGGGFASYLGHVAWFDSLSKMLVTTGEETGRLSSAFFQVARDTEVELEAGLKMATKLIEPALMLLMGLSVGFVVIGTVLPIFDMSAIVK